MMRVPKTWMVRCGSDEELEELSLLVSEIRLIIGVTRVDKDNFLTVVEGGPSRFAVWRALNSETEDERNPFIKLTDEREDEVSDGSYFRYGDKVVNIERVPRHVKDIRRRENERMDQSKEVSRNQPTVRERSLEDLTGSFVMRTYHCVKQMHN
ncbi:unnamed protein product [Lepeophtheirus salmonis]|uniref:(salmon louse) hypothetical protein n=1 Tax=Lepeophtheirus salmonis TaxID=72036 RepID=A0A7R8D3E2_LEPSM|nr:unnamed protein product [Lepeophtheirus salmonis]CAF3016160.1 unnamed protein product [Lepeophtheirus salmonis]